MTLDKTVKYGTRFGDKNTNSPTGSYKNKTNSSANDGSFLEQDWANDAYDGLNGAFLANVHDASTGEPQGYTNPFNQDGTVTINGLVDTAQASQVYNAWYKKTSDIVDAKIAELITLSEGCWFTYYSGGNTNAQVLSGSTTLEAFNFNDSASGADKTLNNNNINVTGDGTELTFLKSGMYAIKLTFFTVNTTNLSDSKFQIEINKPSIGSYQDYTGETNTFCYSAYESIGANEEPTRNGAIEISKTIADDSAGFSQYMAYGLTQPDFMIAVDEDNTKIKLSTMIKSGSTSKPYNLQLSLFRIGKYISNYTLPTDIVTAP